jgi:hypothetical protein
MPRPVLSQAALDLIAYVVTSEFDQLLPPRHAPGRHPALGRAAFDLMRTIATPGEGGVFAFDTSRTPALPTRVADLKFLPQLPFGRVGTKNRLES